MPEEQAERKDSNEQDQPQKKVIELNIGVIAAAIAALILMPIVTYFIVVKAVDVRTKTEEMTMRAAPINYSLTPIVVNIAETKGTRFLKITVSFSLENEKLVQEFGIKNAQITDILIGLCSSRALEELEQNMGREQLKKDIIARVNPLLDNGRILNVFFSEFVIQ